MRKIVWMIPALALALGACGQAVPAASAPTPGQVTSAPAAAPTEPPAATSAPRPGGGMSVRPPDALVAAAQQRLAQHLKVPADSLALQSANFKEWPDGSLGCPQPGQVYPQVVTNGFLLVFSNASQSQTYEVHTAESEQQMILCQGDQATNLSDGAAGQPAPTDGASQATAASRPLVEQARQALAQELGISADAVTLQQVEQTEWRDSSLGCPKPGMNYLQVITPGYRITLAAQGRSYEYHTDTGKRAVRCDAPAETAEPGAAAPDQSPLANTAWKLEAFGDAGAPKPVVAGSEVTITFDGAKGMVGGRSGCNSYGGGYSVAGDKITFGEIRSTLMACDSQPLMEQEAQFQAALGAVEGYKIEGQRLELTYAGTKVLRLVAMPATP